jgi:hypothetical protein
MKIGVHIVGDTKYHYEDTMIPCSQKLYHNGKLVVGWQRVLVTQKGSTKMVYKALFMNDNGLII